MAKKIFNVNFFAVLLVLLAWNPSLIQSESMTLTTYYPAPYAGYESLLTTGNTYLATDSGAMLQWGGASYSGQVSKITSDSNGIITLAPKKESDDPFINFRPGTIMIKANYTCSAYKVATNSCSNPKSDKKNRISLLEINGNLKVDSDSSIRSLCEFKHYSKNTTKNSVTTTYCGPDIPATEWTKTGSWWHDLIAGIAASIADEQKRKQLSFNYIVVGIDQLHAPVDKRSIDFGQNRTSEGEPIRLLESGNMVCCKINATPNMI